MAHHPNGLLKIREGARIEICKNPASNEANAVKRKPARHVAQSGSLFTKIPERDDFTQGAFGNCYIMAALHAILMLPNGPEIVQRCMRQEPDGKHVTVRFYDKTNVARYFRLEKSIWKPRLAPAPRATGTSVLWVNMIEKAYVKLAAEDEVQEALKKAGKRDDETEKAFGKRRYDLFWKKYCYESASGGLSYRVFRALVGGPETSRSTTSAKGKKSMSITLRERIDAVRRSLLAFDEARNQLLVILIASVPQLVPRRVHGALLARLDAIKDEFQAKGRSAENQLAKQAKVNAVIDEYLKKAAARVFGAQWERLLDEWRKWLAAKISRGPDLLGAMDKDWISFETLLAELRDKSNLSAELHDLILGFAQTHKLLDGSTLSGRYSMAQLDFVAELRRYFAMRLPVAAGTPENITTHGLGKARAKGKSAGEQIFRGLAGKHAYSVIGVRSDRVGDIDYIAVGVKNPWGGRFHREYTVKSGKLSPNGYRVIGFGHNTKGVSWLELSDFLTSFDRLYVGRNPVKDQLHAELLDAVQKRKKRLADQQSMVKNRIRHYEKLIDEVQKDSQTLGSGKKSAPVFPRRKPSVGAKKAVSHLPDSLRKSVKVVESEDGVQISWNKTLV